MIATRTLSYWCRDDPLEEGVTGFLSQSGARREPRGGLREMYPGAGERLPRDVHRSVCDGRRGRGSVPQDDTDRSTWPRALARSRAVSVERRLEQGPGDGERLAHRR